jgi:hypothetical protein
MNRGMYTPSQYVSDLFTKSSSLWSASEQRMLSRLAGINAPRYERQFRKIQIDLIYHYFPMMDEQTRRRAAWTLRQLQ